MCEMDSDRGWKLLVLPGKFDITTSILEEIVKNGFTRSNKWSLRDWTETEEELL